MKTALAFVCSLMLAWTNVVLAQAPDAGVASAAPSCQCGKKTGCCAAKNSRSELPPVSAAPTSSFQNQVSLIAPASVSWSLPESPARKFPASLPITSSEDGAPLFERNCAWVI
jgi:hypothetical protein